MVRVVNNMAEFKAAQAEAGGKVVVVDFSATWCGPCQRIAPKFEAFSEDPKYKEKVLFLKVDVDVADEFAQSCGIQSLPTFQFYHDGKKIDEFKGADENKLREMLDRYAA